MALSMLFNVSLDEVPFWDDVGEFTDFVIRVLDDDLMASGDTEEEDLLFSKLKKRRKLRKEGGN